MTGSKDKRYSAPALEKGLDILELLAREPRGLTTTEIARRLSRTPSEIFRMLLTLEHRGYILQQEDNRHTLTLGLFRLAQEHRPWERLLSESIPVMNRLVEQICQSCHLVVAEASQVVVIAQANWPKNGGIQIKVGSTLDLIDSTGGQVILAHQLPSVLKQAITQWEEKSQREAPKDLNFSLARIKAQGMEQRANPKMKGVVDISYPISGNSGSVVAALSASCVEQIGGVLHLQKIHSFLLAATNGISVALENE